MEVKGENGGLEIQVMHKDGEKEVTLRKAQNTEMKISRRNNAQEWRNRISDRERIQYLPMEWKYLIILTPATSTRHY